MTDDPETGHLVVSFTTPSNQTVAHPANVLLQHPAATVEVATSYTASQKPDKRTVPATGIDRLSAPIIDNR